MENIQEMVLKECITRQRIYCKQHSIVYQLNSCLNPYFNLFSLSLHKHNRGKLSLDYIEVEILLQDNCMLSKYSLVKAEPKIKWGCTFTHSFIGEMSNIRGDKVEINSNNNIHIVQFNKIVFFETKYYNTYIDKEFMQFLQSNYLLMKIISILLLY